MGLHPDLGPVANLHPDWPCVSRPLEYQDNADQYLKHDGYVHTNAAESHFAVLKPGFAGTFLNRQRKLSCTAILAKFDFWAGI